MKKKKVLLKKDRLNEDQFKRMIKWINQLSQEELSRFEKIYRLQVAQTLMLAFLSSNKNIPGKNEKSRKKRSR